MPQFFAVNQIIKGKLCGKNFMNILGLSRTKYVTANRSNDIF